MNKEMTVERTEENNWGDKMIFGEGHPKCPKCGVRCDDDGDRYFTENCWECGWRSNKDRANQNMNEVRKILSNVTQAMAIYSEAIDDQETDWNSVANQIELSLQVIRIGLDDREKRLFPDE